MTTTDARLILRTWLLEQQGKPYVFGAKGPDTFDCSGLVTCGLLHVGHADWRQTHNAQRLWDELDPVFEPEDLIELDLGFYGQRELGRIDHVMFFLDHRAYGATGGNHHTTDVERAKAIKACVKFKDAGLGYRFDLRGYRRLPLP